ncbi:MAG: hypothetical protein ACE15F_09815 [bacterium]
MNGIGGWRLSRLLGLGAAALAVLAGIQYGPALPARWEYQFYRNQYQARRTAEAARMLPKFDALSAPLKHIQYQEFMKSAGQSGDLERQYTFLASRHSGNATALALAGRAASDPDVRRRYLEKAVQLAPSDEFVRLIQIETDLNAGRIQAALDAFGQIKTIHWYSASLIARARWNQGNTSQILDSYAKALEDPECPGWVNIQYARFLCEQDAARGPNPPNPFPGWDEARFRDEPEAYAYRVWLSGEPIQQAAQILPPSVRHHPEALIILAQAALQRNLGFQSLSGKDKMPGVNPSSAKSEELQAARALLRQAGWIASSQPEWIASRGLLALADNQPGRAREYFTTGLRTGAVERDADFHERMAHILLAFKRLDDATLHYQKAWGHIPENGLILRKTGMELLKQHQYDEAIARLNQAHTLAPRDRETLEALIRAYEAKGDLDAALKSAARILDMYFHDQDARARLAQLWLKKNQPNRAIGLYATYLDSFPNAGTCYAQIARIHLQLGNKARAERILRNALNDHPAIEDKEEILELLKEIESGK